jgi:hypothetical protein
MKTIHFQPYTLYNFRMQNPVSSPEKAPPAKHPGGRPTIYRPELGQQLIVAMAGGLSAEAAAAKIGIGARTLFTWQQQQPQFQQSIQEGRNMALLYWETLALDVARGKPGNAQLITLALKNRSRAASGWHHDVQKTELTGADGGAIQTEVKTTIDASALAPEARAALRAAILAGENIHSKALWVGALPMYPKHHGVAGRNCQRHGYRQGHTNRQFFVGFLWG